MPALRRAAAMTALAPGTLVPARRGRRPTRMSGGRRCHPRRVFARPGVRWSWPTAAPSRTGIVRDQNSGLRSWAISA